MFWWILACDGVQHSDARLYQQGLRTGDCAEIREVDYRDDCYAATASMRKEDPCGAIQADRMREECWFHVAERTNDPALCVRAGAFRDDCSLHLLSSDFRSWVPVGTLPGQDEERIEEKIREAGMDPEDPRPWSAYYRWLHGGQRPLDRRLCAAVSNPTRQEACYRTGIAHYNDLLNNARDRHIFPCPKGSALPPSLAYTPDPELDALIAGREDLCP